MEITFTDKKFEKLIKNRTKSIKELGKIRAAKMMLRMNQLTYARNLEDLRDQSGRYHELSGNRKGQWACNLDHPYRLIFTPHEIPIPIKVNDQYMWSEFKGVEVIEIINYH